MRKALVIISALIALSAFFAIRIVLTDGYATCKNSRAMTYVDDLAPTIGEQISTVASCERMVVHSNAPSPQMALTLAAVAALICSLLYNFRSERAVYNGHVNERLAEDTRPLLEERAAPSSLIGPTVALKGGFSSDGDFQVEGSIDGGIQCADLIIARTGKVYGDVIANRVLIRGQFKGVLRANEVTLAPGSRVEGTVWQKTLRIDAGARFEGECRHSNAPLANMGTKLMVEPVPSLQEPAQKLTAIAGL